MPVELGYHRYVIDNKSDRLLKFALNRYDNVRYSLTQIGKKQGFTKFRKSQL